MLVSTGECENVYVCVRARARRSRHNLYQYVSAECGIPCGREDVQMRRKQDILSSPHLSLGTISSSSSLSQSY